MTIMIEYRKLGSKILHEAEFDNSDDLMQWMYKNGRGKLVVNHVTSIALSGELISQIGERV